ncbi:pyrroline-5-carboxylate reductase [Demequina flava]|uniref:pyrroline-5-carboxylate reductase n=1 Tax=Demequina flava TaxID=1095025 RepID=UPI000783418B|nr:pyrroline-5-carboxylate reductase [Demequina flava]
MTSTAMNEASIAVLGGGNMAGAIARRLLSTAPYRRMRVTTGSSVPEWVADGAAAEHRAVSADPEANLWAVDGADVVILGVKPKGIVDLAAEIAPALQPGALVLSVAAGTRLDAMDAVLPDTARLVRTMPNTPTAIGRGTTLVCALPGNDDALADAEAVLAPTGVVERIDEHLIDAFTAVTGSGPAYVFYFAQALREAAISMGADYDQASRIVPAMFSGAVAYMEEAGELPETLRQQVTSPGGSTAAAVAVFDERDLFRTVGDALNAARRRNIELGE